MNFYKIKTEEVSYDPEEGFLLHYTVLDLKKKTINIVCTCRGTSVVGVDNLKVNFYSEDHRPIQIKYSPDFFNELELLVYQDVSEEEEHMLEEMYKGGPQ